MEVQNTPMARSEVDTTRPFRSVKEAVAVFGDRILSTNSSFKTNTIPNSSSHKTNANHSLHSPPELIPEATAQNQNVFSCNTDTISKLDSSPKFTLIPSPPLPFCASPINKPMYSAPSSPPSYTSSVSNGTKEHENEAETENIVFGYLRRLELEVAETKKELNALKKRESEMEIALASLNAQLNRNLAKLSEIEASNEEEISVVMGEKPSKVPSTRWEETVQNEVHYEYIPSLADALSLRDFGDEFSFTRNRKVQKMKPIVPLVGDIFTRKKNSKENNSLYSESIYSVLG